MSNFTVRIETTNPRALELLTKHLEAFPLDTDIYGHLHPLTVEITDDSDALLWASEWAPEQDDEL